MSGSGFIYWTSSEADVANAYRWDEYPMLSPIDKTKDYNSSNKMAVRPCIAF